MNEMSEELEEKVFVEAKKYLDKGRANWDLNHTLAAVYWMKKLLEVEDGDTKILVTAMYLHDVGYSNLSKNWDYSVMSNFKELHMERGMEIAKNILDDLDFLDSEKEEIIRLIGIHDKLSELSSFNELLVMEADSLAQIDLERVSHDSNYGNLLIFLDSFKKKRAVRFFSETGKKYLSELLPKIEIHFSSFLP